MTVFLRSRLGLLVLTAIAASGSPACQPCACRALALHPGNAQGGAAGGSSAQGAVAGIPYSWGNVVILGGGFVSGVVFSPVEKGLVYVRTDVGGAYRWNPSNATWTPITDQFSRADANYMGVESIAVDPVDANRVYAAVGTYVKAWAGNGAMLRSTDRGNTWARTDMSIKMGGNEYGRSNGERLAVDPNQRNIIYFGSRADGLWRSTDSGATWSKASFPVASDPNGFGIVFVVFDARSGGPGKATPTLYAGVAKTDTPLFVSTDGGGTWKPLANQPKGLLPSHAAFDARGTLYISYGSAPGPNDVVDGAVWKYEPQQGAFVNISPAAPDKTDHFGYGGLAVDAPHPGTLMVTTIDRWTKGDEIYRTVDGGKSWKALGPKAVRDDAGAKYLYWDHDKPSATGWMGDIDIDPFDTAHVFYTTGQGVWACDDASAAEADKPTHWSFRDRGIEETVVAGLASPPSGPPLLSVVGDLGGFRHDDIAAPSPTGMFHNPIFGGGTDIDFAWNKPEIVARVGSNDAGKYGALSVDGGAKWTPFAAQPHGKGSGTIGVSADGSSFVWAPKEQAPVYSRDRGATWTPVQGGPEPSKIPDWAPLNIRVAADRVNPNKFYIYDAITGRAYASSDGGAHFVESRSGLPTLPEYNLSAGSALAVPGVEGNVWLTTGKEVFRSIDSGKTYDTVPGVTESLAMGFGKAAPSKKHPTVYVVGKIGDLYGFFRSDDEGASWTRINDDDHQFGYVGAISGDPRIYGRVYVGTGGRGIVLGDPK